MRGLELRADTSRSVAKLTIERVGGWRRARWFSRQKSLVARHDRPCNSFVSSFCIRTSASTFQRVKCHGSLIDFIAFFTTIILSHRRHTYCFILSHSSILPHLVRLHLYRVSVSPVGCCLMASRTNSHFCYSYGAMHVLPERGIAIR